FVSHSGTDVALAAAVVNLLVAAFGLAKRVIRCTSVPGCRLSPGIDANVQLSRDIRTAKVFVGLITGASVESSYVLFELGARWGRDTSIIPLLGPGAPFSILPGPIAPRHALHTAVRTDIQEMLEKVSKDLGKTLRPSHDYEGELSAL